MRRTLAALAVLSWSFLVTRVEPAKRIATVHGIQPSPRDVCHAVWMHGPTHGGKLGGQWPTFAPKGNRDTSAQCTTRDDRFTGYNGNGQYCEKASDELNTNAHLLLYSGHLAVVVDAAGISAATPQPSSTRPRNLFPKFGSTTGLAANVRVDSHSVGPTLVTTSCAPLHVHGPARHIMMPVPWTLTRTPVSVASLQTR